MKLIILMIIMINISLFGEITNYKTQKIIGISVGYSSIKTNKFAKENTNKDIFLGATVGAQNKKWRTLISSHFFSNKKEKYYNYLLQLNNYLLSYFDKKNNLIYKPYIGANVGYTFTSSSEENVGDKKGLAYGGQAGIVFNLFDKVDFDFGYQHVLNQHKDIKSISNAYVSVNYLY